MLTPNLPCSHPGCPHPAVKEWVWEPDDQVYLCEEHVEYYTTQVDEIVEPRP